MGLPAFMAGRVQSLYRYPVKGFSPERMATATLVAHDYFPCDRVYAVENGPSGFDPFEPAFVPKTAFTVLASIPKVARAKTRFDEERGLLFIEARGWPPFVGCLRDAAGRDALAAWLTGFLGPDEVRGPLRVLCAPPHRFTDHPKGFVSVVNLASVRDLEAKVGRPVDPLRFRANLYVEGWPAWREMEWEAGAEVMLGRAAAEVFKPIVRCVATHVDPDTGERDMEVVPAIWTVYGHRYCGLYLNVVQGGRVDEGDCAEPVL
jgi:uncharacterized protein YcbX